jgi:hypothetical protein
LFVSLFVSLLWRLTLNLSKKLEFHQEKKKPKCMTALLTSPGEEQTQMHDLPSHFTALLTSPGEEKTQIHDHPSHFTRRRKNPNA